MQKHEAGGQAYYQVVAEPARVVPHIFEWLGRDRVTLWEVCRRLREQGIPSPKGQPVWNREVSGPMLKNPAYKGSAVFGRTRVGERLPRLRPARGHREQPRPAHARYPGAPEDPMVIPVPALVRAALFEAAAAQVAENRPRSRQHRRGPGYLLQGLLACACCGSASSGKGATRFALNPKAPYPYYRCTGTDAFRFAGTRLCQNKPIRLDRLDAAVWADVCSVLPRPADLRREFERRLCGGAEPDVSLGPIRKQLTAVQRSISRLSDAYEDGLREQGDFAPRMRQAKARLSRLQQEAAAAEDRGRQREALRLVLGQLDVFVAQVRERLEPADWNTRGEIIRGLVKCMRIEREQVRIV